MKRLSQSMVAGWTRLGPQFLPFADAATPELPLARLLRLSLFQVSVGIALALLIGTLNRVMIVELGVPATIVGAMVALPLVFAPFRALIGFRSDVHKSVLGWKRVPYIWIGTLLQFGGFAIMPFALLVMTGEGYGPKIYGELGGALAFLLVGAGIHTTQTVGLALATDVAPLDSQPKVVALMCSMLLIGIAVAALVFGALLSDFSPLRLVQVIQGTAVVTIVLNMAALWKQEPRDPARTAPELMRPTFQSSWLEFSKGGQAVRRLVALGLGTIAFSMQDILLEPYGGQVLKLSVGTTTALTAMLALGGLAGFVLAARALTRGVDAYRAAAYGALVGLTAFTALIFAAPTGSPLLFACGVALIGLGSGLFGHCTLTAAMGLAPKGQIGLALGVWGAVQATAAGGSIALGSVIRDAVASLADAGRLGTTLTGPAVGYGAVYSLEIVLLFATLVAIGPLVRHASTAYASTRRGVLWPHLNAGNTSEEVVP